MPTTMNKLPSSVTGKGRFTVGFCLTNLSLPRCGAESSLRIIFLPARRASPCAIFGARGTAAAKLPGLLFHDLRRSAIRNMIRRNVPQKTARIISSHKTDSVFSLYNIVSDDDIADAARKMEDGAKAALKGLIHSSLMVTHKEEASTEPPQAKHLYNQ